MRTIRYAVMAGAATVMVLGPLAAPAVAHVEPDKEEVTAGGFDTITLTVPHGCGESPTVALAIQIPEGFVSVSPHVKPGWDITTETEALSPPVTDEEGGEITERTSVVTFTGGPLPVEFTDTFTIGFQAPDTPGERAYFKTIQTCEQGETAWVEEWDGEGDEPEHPAPAVNIVAGDEGEEAHGDGGSEGTDVAAGGDEAASDTDDGDSGGSNTLSIVALVVGAAGLVVGGVALARGRRPAS
jgi:uncharacterized protein YcnI